MIVEDFWKYNIHNPKYMGYNRGSIWKYNDIVKYFIIIHCIGDIIGGGYGSGGYRKFLFGSDRKPCVSPDGLLCPHFYNSMMVK